MNHIVLKIKMHRLKIMIESLKTAASTVVLRDRKRWVGYAKDSKGEDKWSYMFPMALET